MRRMVTCLLLTIFFAGGTAHGYQDKFMEKMHNYQSDKPTMKEVRRVNCNNLEKLKNNMSKEKVLEIMGEKKIDCVVGIEEKSIDNPYKRELKTRGNRQFEVLYYYTHVKERDRKITEDELTPVVLENDRLIGWGWDFFEKTIPVQTH